MERIGSLTHADTFLLLDAEFPFEYLVTCNGANAQIPNMEL